jgi:hypothetical protein
MIFIQSLKTSDPGNSSLLLSISGERLDSSSSDAPPPQSETYAESEAGYASRQSYTSPRVENNKPKEQTQCQG